MDNNVVIRTIVPILLLMIMGFISRKVKVLKSGDERVLNAYLYYFAFPALLFINLAQSTFTEETLRFVLAGIIPVPIAIILFVE
ncbi:AEC family transporter, partial [Candidatus Bathyarchaeota archaeon]|nr:AEC family transporter [Candidatus Bathyarchaeota archaeon]